MAKSSRQRSFDPPSSSFLMTGNEAPICKIIKPSQLYTDYALSPLRKPGSFAMNGIHSRTSSYQPPLSHSVLSLAQKVVSKTNKCVLLRKLASAKQSGLRGSVSHADLRNKSILKHTASPQVNPSFNSENKLPISLGASALIEALPSTHSTTDRALTENRGCEASYVPYTLKDYRRIESQPKRRLGGLGPSNIGTVEWETIMQHKRKMTKYSQQILPKLRGSSDRSKSVPKVA
jgi:hypothetical protein